MAAATAYAEWYLVQVSKQGSWVFDIHRGVGNVLFRLLRGDPAANVDWRTFAVQAVMLFAPACILTLAVYLVMVRLTVGRKRTADRETHCRQCGYILRGLLTPRCPECGEVI